MSRAFWLACVLVFLGACSDSNDNPQSSSQYAAEIRRTDYGIPHITAKDWTGLGYGFGYAYAQDNFCVTMREVVFGTGRSAELMGEEEGDVESDLLFRFLNGDKESFKKSFVDELPPFALELADGFTRGMNRYLEETGVENLPEGQWGCRNAPWVYAFDSVDYMMFVRAIALQGSSNQGVLRRGLLSVTGPATATAATAPTPDALALAANNLNAATAALRTPDLGSNGLALGRDATRNGRGMLLGNPHQPWFGNGAWYQAQLTIPGVYDVAGAALHGTPFIGIGFNKDVAWTHTVSYANRFSLYELKLNPDNPLQYDYDGQWRDIGQQAVEVLAKQPDGSLQTRSYTFYTSHYGPIINLKEQSSLLDGWPMFNGSVLAFRDANLRTGIRSVGQWTQKAQASNLQEYIDALDVIGNPLFHDLAADRNGDAFYGEISAIPFLTQAQLDHCIEPPIGTLLAQLTTGVLVSLNGADSSCEWGTDPDAPAGSNLYGSAKLPKIVTTDYLGNSNNSYWLSDANHPLEGFPRIMGPLGYEGLQQFPRTQLGHIMVDERKHATDGLDPEPLFDLQSLEGMMYSNRVHVAELVLDDVLQICATQELSEACAALAGWDRKVNLDSRGAQVFVEFWKVIRAELVNQFQDVVESDEFWTVDFDPEDPLHTPAGIDISLDSNRQRVIAALTTASERLAAAGVPLDAPWGEVQVLQRNEENVPIHGGPGTAGVYGAISVPLSEGGYINPTSGNSYIQAVTWDDSECPVADVILVPSQSTDPASPHYADQTKLYSNKEWIRFPFCDDQIAAQQVGETLV
ncbi:MAG TPA: penicillin acylase family protein, partial [Halioglobus sp.]